MMLGFVQLSLLLVSPIQAWQHLPTRQNAFRFGSRNSVTFGGRQASPRHRPLASSESEDSNNNSDEFCPKELDSILAEADAAISATDATIAKGSALCEDNVEELGNLIADGEWDGLGMELSEVIRLAIQEDLKNNAREFLGKDEYEVGDFSKEIDARVKDEVAKFRQKDQYELGDLTAALDQASKELTCQFAGKDDYEFGDLSTELDRRIKNGVASYCGKEGEEYQVGDLSNEVDRRVKESVIGFTSKGNYEFGGKCYSNAISYTTLVGFLPPLADTIGYYLPVLLNASDVSREIERRRAGWVSTFTDKVGEDYEFGDVTKKTLSNFTGKEDYKFGDVSKKLMGGLFGKDKK
jgi:hypothetical protein